MKKKYVGVSYESDSKVWKLTSTSSDDIYALQHHLDCDDPAHLTVLELIQLHELLDGMLTDIGAKQPIQISSPSDSFAPTVAKQIDPRFHPDPDGVMSL